MSALGSVGAFGSQGKMAARLIDSDKNDKPMIYCQLGLVPL
jgi:hypothetical protein